MCGWGNSNPIGGGVGVAGFCTIILLSDGRRFAGPYSTTTLLSDGGGLLDLVQLHFWVMGGGLLGLMKLTCLVMKRCLLNLIQLPYCMFGVAIIGLIQLLC